jgi:hypothetical protein
MIKFLAVFYLQIDVLVCTVGAQISSPFANYIEGVRAALEKLIS